MVADSGEAERDLDVETESRRRWYFFLFSCILACPLSSEAESSELSELEEEDDEELEELEEEDEEESEYIPECCFRSTASAVAANSGNLD